MTAETFHQQPSTVVVTSENSALERQVRKYFQQFKTVAGWDTSVACGKDGLEVEGITGKFLFTELPNREVQNFFIDWMVEDVAPFRTWEYNSPESIKGSPVHLTERRKCAIDVFIYETAADGVTGTQGWIWRDAIPAWVKGPPLSMLETPKGIFATADAAWAKNDYVWVSLEPRKVEFLTGKEVTQYLNSR